MLCVEDLVAVSNSHGIVRDAHAQDAAVPVGGVGTPRTRDREVDRELEVPYGQRALVAVGRGRDVAGTRGLREADVHVPLWRAGPDPAVKFWWCGARSAGR